jgi:nitronate monooxygenase
MLRTPLCDLFGIDVPIVNAPMGGGVAGGQLAAAVSEAGGLGMIGGTTERGADWLRAQIEEARRLTSKPFGVGFISHLPSAAPLAEVAAEMRVPIVCHSFVDPAPFMATARKAGALVICQVGTVEGARLAAAAGVDAIVAQGTEAGGHTGRVATLPLVPAVIDAVAPIPVIAAGGIADGRGIASALVLGADGVWMGTRFLATPECNSRPTTRDRILAAEAGDTVLTEVFDLAKGMPWPPGILGRSIRNPFTDRWHGAEAELRAWGSEQRAAYRAAAVSDPDQADVYAGDAAGLIHAVEPAGRLVARLAADAEAVLRDRLDQLLSHPMRR